MEKPSREALLNEPLDTFSAFWLDLACRCEHPRWQWIVGLLNGRSDQTLSQLLPRMKCDVCGARPVEVWVREVKIRERIGLGQAPGWAVQVLP